MMNKCAESRKLDVAKIESNKPGAIFIVPIDATTEWIGMDSKIAIMLGEWIYINPTEGMLFWIKDEQKFIVYTNGAWIEPNLNTR